MNLVAHPEVPAPGEVSACEAITQCLSNPERIMLRQRKSLDVRFFFRRMTAMSRVKKKSKFRRNFDISFTLGAITR
ncbi:hypothetical protein [Mycolicibacterium sp.]|uniref:hypothetical protein n=1 Tax=Mycolicibacterium sp. TaxID=2320850 RepID=UPI0037C8CE7F